MRIINGEAYREVRCNTCRSLVGLEYVYDGRHAYYCPKCKKTWTISYKHRSGAKESEPKVVQGIKYQ